MPPLMFLDSTFAPLALAVHRLCCVLHRGPSFLLVSRDLEWTESLAVSLVLGLSQKHLGI